MLSIPTNEQHGALAPTETYAQWVATFERRHGRPLRVLHIGNIANNAYRNAAIQRAIGIEADVVCYDYYHVMGCPEWEEADLSGDYDAFYPDWWTLKSNRLQRPDWFIQGPMRLCIEHLKARQSGDPNARRETRLALVKAYADILDARADRDYKSKRDILAPEHMQTTWQLAPELAINAGQAEPVPSRLHRLGVRYASRRWRNELIHHTADELAASPMRRRYRGITARRNDARRLQLSRLIRKLARGDATAEPDWSVYSPAYPFHVVLARLAAGLTVSTVLRPLRPWLREKPVAEAESVVQLIADPVDVAARYRHEATGTATPAEIEQDIVGAMASASLWRDVLPAYDIVQGYSVDGLIPLFAGHPNFLAYEHGTIREIPFEPTTQGRLCRFTYKHAPRVLITNTDVLPSADRIPIEPARRICMPHAFDDAPLRAFSAQALRTIKRPERLTLFSPTRHHWQPFDPSLSKGNDVLLRGTAMAADAGVDVELWLIEWGQHVEASKRLIGELGIEKRVRWLGIMNRRELWHTYLQCHAVVDQFALAALGGVGYEALTLGARLVTNLDETAVTTFFGACPPAFIAATPEAVADSIRTIANDPDDTARRGAAGADWARRYHSTDRILDLQVRAYRELLAGQTP